MKFVKVKNKVSIIDLEILGFRDGDKVMVLFGDGRVLWGTLGWVTEYSTLFETQISFMSGFGGGEDLVDAVGMIKVELE